MIKADLHIHSTVSDGKLSIEEIIRTAEEKKLDAIAITDHDTISHLSQMPDDTKVKIIPGLEVSAFDYYKNIKAHVLGYNIKNLKIIKEFTEPTLKARLDNSMRQINILKREGFKIDIDKVLKGDGKYIYKQHIMEYLVKTGQITEMFGNFYYRVFKNNGICHFDIKYPDVYKAVEVIKKAGGLAVLAHSGQQQNFYLVPELVKLGLDGLEINHHANSEGDKVKIRELAEKYDLFLTGGSDFHGIYEPQIYKIGDFISEKSGINAMLYL